MFPHCCLTGGQAVVEVMKIMSTSFQRSSVGTAALGAPNPAAGHHQHMPPPESPGHSGQVWVSLLCGHCSFILGPGGHKILFLPSKGLFPQSCVSSGGSMVALMVTSSKRTYSTPRSAAPRGPAPQQSTADPYLHRRHLNTVLSQFWWCLYVLVHTRFV